MAKKKADESNQEPAPEAASEGKITQKEAVKQALAAGKELPPDGVKFVKDTFGITLNNGAFSTIKSQIKKAAGESKPRGRAPRAAAAEPALPPSGTNGPSGLATSVEAIKVLCDTLGYDQVVAIARLFAK